ncbi:ankyrin repeat domain-containing protein [bacterium]|nr:MAG: ankyrin repeat domain-containing protein [bacterium]
MHILRYFFMMTIVLVAQNDVVFPEVLTPAHQLSNLIDADTSVQTIKDFLNAHRGMNIKNINPHPIFLIFKAIELKNPDVASFLINQGIDIEAKDETGRTVLHEAARQGLLSVVELLVKKGLDVNIPTFQHYTPLHFAIFGGREEIVRFCLDKGASLNVLAKSNTPLSLAAGKGMIEIVKLLLDRGADFTKMPPIIFSAVSSANEEMVRLLIERGLGGVNVKHWNGLFALMLAVNKGLKNIASLLLENGADVNLKRDSDNSTSLHLAVQNGDKEIVKVLLLRTGIDVNAQNKEGNTPLHLAVLKDNLEIVILLLQQGADVTLKNNEENKAADLSSHEEIKDALERAESKKTPMPDLELPKTDTHHKKRKRRYLSYMGALDLVAKIDRIAEKVNTDAAEHITDQAHKKLAELQILDETIRNQQLNATERMANENKQQELYKNIAALLNEIEREKSSITK